MISSYYNLTDKMKSDALEKTEMHGVCEVEAGDAPHAKPLKVKVSVQKRGWWWRCVPRASFKQVAVFPFHGEEYYMTTPKTYTSMPAAMDMGRLLKARHRSGDALVKIVLTHSQGKVVTFRPVADFMRRLGKGETEDFVLGLTIDDGNTKAPEQQHKQDDACETNERKGMVEEKTPWVGKMCPKCPLCTLPFWDLLQAWEPLPVKPPTEMDTYVDILSAECTVLKTDARVLVKEKQSSVSELAALKAEMARMEQEMDRLEASWASDLMEEGEGEPSLELGGMEEEDCGSRNEEEWRELLGDYSAEEKSYEDCFTLDEGHEHWNIEDCKEEGSDGEKEAEAESDEHIQEWKRHESNPSMHRALSLLRRHNAPH